MKKRKDLLIMVGVPGSGKSTLANSIPNANVVSRDKIRLDVLGDEPFSFKRENEVFNTFISEIRNSVLKNNVTIADATHIDEKSRKKLLSNLKINREEVAITAVYFNVPMLKCLEQNKERARKGGRLVPELVIVTTSGRLTKPQLTEGFDVIQTIGEER